MATTVMRHSRGGRGGKKASNPRRGESNAGKKIAKRRARNPEATLKDILEASLSCMAAGGSEGVSLLRVAQMARVNRSTAYEYFQTRENLIERSIEWASNQLLGAVFGDLLAPGETPIENVEKILTQHRAGDVLEYNKRLANFAMTNPELCRVWLTQVLTLPNPATDPFWRTWQGSTSYFAKTKFAQKNIDAGVFTVIILAGAFLWPISARAHAKTGKGLRAQADRYVRECLRLSLFGAIRPEHFPELVQTLEARGSNK